MNAIKYAITSNHKPHVCNFRVSICLCFIFKVRVRVTLSRLLEEFPLRTLYDLSCPIILLQVMMKSDEIQEGTLHAAYLNQHASN